MTTPLHVRSPYSGQELARLAYASPAEVQHTLGRAREAFTRWRESSAFERSQLLLEVAAELEARRDEFAALIRDEAGKPITFAQVEVDRALGTLRWAAGEAQRFGGEVLRIDAGKGGRAGMGVHQKFPRGVILGITPFNFPLNLTLHKVAPAVACGCAIVIKPSSMTPMSAIRLAALFEKHVPGLVQVALTHDEGTRELTRAREIAMVSFTGSARVGFEIRRQVPDRPVTLELGGNAWCIVAEDLPESAYAAVARRIAAGAFGYAGQSCISVQNVAVARAVWPRFKESLAQATRDTVFGNPSDASVVSGPLINESARKRVAETLAKAGVEGSNRIQSEKRVGSVEVAAPTLLFVDEKDDSELTREEVFAPIMTARPYSDVGALIARINSGRYGLQAGVFTQNLALIERLYADLEVGGLVVNDAPTTRYDHQPYGGVKDSGQGREGLRYAMDEMCESKFLALSSRLPG